jgi:hypothetical protein
MTALPDQYTELLKRGQDAALAALETCRKTVQQALGQLPHPGPISPEQVIDQAHDFAGHVLNAQRELAGHMLNAQRDLAKQALAAGTAAAGKVRESMAQDS